jgi:hypothetical protein
MATLLDVGLVGYFSNIFPFIFVWAIVFASLQKTKVIGTSMGINATIAAVAGLMVLLSQSLINIINFMVPWFAVLIIFFVLMMLAFMSFGAKEADFSSALKNRTVLYIMIAVTLGILGAAVANEFGQTATEASFGGGSVNDGSLPVDAEGGEISSTATSNFQTNLFGIVTHPKVLGMMVLFAVVIFAIALLTRG